MRMVLEHKLIILPLLLIFLSLLLLINNFDRVKIAGYKITRNIYIEQCKHKTKDYKVLKGKKFNVKYKENLQNAELVLKTAEDIYEPVTKILNFTPEGVSSIIMYPTMKEFNDNFGWEGEKSPMGVYWMGSIGVLSPDEWIFDENKELIFKTMGPVAHEYTHYLVDYKTNGNYTRWFTEGLAQYVEKKVTGYTLLEPSKEAMQNIYFFSDLDQNFDKQDNIDLAYWQSLIAIEYLVDKEGPEIINKLLDELAVCTDFEYTFKKVVGQSMPEFEIGLRYYISNKYV